MCYNPRLTKDEVNSQLDVLFIYLYIGGLQIINCLINLKRNSLYETPIGPIFAAFFLLFIRVMVYCCD